jgi:hypothetical protein
LPLTQKVTFKTASQKGNRIQIPKIVRWQFKIETNQVLRVNLNSINAYSGTQTFYAKMTKDGRILIPNLIIRLIKEQRPNIQGFIFNVTLEPT